MTEALHGKHTKLDGTMSVKRPALKLVTTKVCTKAAYNGMLATSVFPSLIKIEIKNAKGQVIRREWSIIRRTRVKPDAPFVFFDTK